MKSIAQITQHYRPIVGGQEVYIENLLAVLARAGFEGKVFQPARGVRADDIVPVFRIKGFPRLVYGSEPYMFSFFLNLFHRRQLAKSDLVISHYAFHTIGLTKVVRKLLVLSHGIEWSITDQNCDDRIHERIARNCFDRFPHVVNDTHYLRHFGCDVAPGQGSFTEVAPGKWFIPNCVDHEVFKRSAGIAELKQEPLILVPRKVSWNRGIHLGIQAFSQFHREVPEAKLLVIGKSWPGAYLKYCHSLIRDLGLLNHVRIVPNVSNREMIDYYSSAGMTIIPTLCKEGTSLSALESMSCGTATVSTNVAGLADLPTVQSLPTPDGLAEAMIRTWKDREVVAERQRKIVTETFNFANWSAAWLEAVRAAMT